MMANTTPRPLYPRERDPERILEGKVWAVRPAGTGAEIPVRTEVQTLTL